MAIASETRDAGGDETLLLNAAEAMLQMFKTARSNESDDEIKVFYSHLSKNCFRIQQCIGRARQFSSHIDATLLDQTLSCLSSLVPQSGLHELPTYSVQSEFRLKMLCLYWDEVKRQDGEAVMDFLQRWLQPSASDEDRNELDKTLETCADELDKTLAKHSLSRHNHEFSSVETAEAAEPPYAVCKAAKSIFDALMDCKGCTCPNQHDFKAKLELGTYRSPQKQAEVTAIHRRSRRMKAETDTGDLELDMFLSMERDWHEVRVQTVKDRAVRFDAPPPLSQVVQKRNAVKQYAKVERLCKPIRKTKTKALQRLILKLNSGQLFEMGFEKSNFQIDRNATPISLSQCFEEKPDFFWEKPKRILSLIIGYTVLHLHGTSWLQPGWGSSNIKFFQTTACRTPLRPFIEAQLPTNKTDSTVANSVNDEDEDDGDELDAGHCLPEVVALAVVLMEIYFAKPFKTLASAHNVQLIETQSGRIPLDDASEVFNGNDQHEGWRFRIPENSSLLEAIDNCLDGEVWEDEEGQPLEGADLRSQLYQKVVFLLENDLTAGFSNIQLDGVDQYARNLDFGNWGQFISSKIPQVPPAIVPPHVMMPGPNASAAFTLLSPGSIVIGAEGWKHMQHAPRLHSYPSYSASGVESVSNLDTEYKTIQFFDDEIGDGDHVGIETEKYKKWKAEYKKVYQKFIANYLPDPPSQPVKVAILDTGIDRDHPFLDAREDNLKGKRNCYNESQKNVPDTHGHGTFTASLILDYAPDVSLYVMKIADNENTRPDAVIVANAINHAVSVWNVDIISMSFGWPSSDFEGYDTLQTAIDAAISKKVLMFAAASNSGGRLGRAYPASSSQVICVHSTNTNGSASDFSPTAEANAINIATVGESVQSSWPMLLCQNKMNDNPTCVKSRSGTSYATPIIAGMAAFLLQYARLHLSESEYFALKRREKMEAVLKRCAVRGPNYVPRDGYFYVHLSLDKHNLFGGELEWVNYEITRALKT